MFGGVEMWHMMILQVQYRAKWFLHWMVNKMSRFLGQMVY